MNPSKIEIRLSENCGDAGLAEIRDVIRQKALRPPGSSGLVFIVPANGADVMIDTHVRRLSISHDVISALESLPSVQQARVTGDGNSRLQG